ncbi:MAG: hypothetical protein AB7E60_14765 [Sphingobium sp.]
MAALPLSSYDFNGSTLWHHVVSEGDFTYNISKTGSNWYGEGSFENLHLEWDFGGLIGDVDIYARGTLANTLIDDQTVANGAFGDYLGVASGNATVTSGNFLIDAAIVIATGAVNPKYDLAIFGPGANDVAGRITLNDQLGSFGIGGVR